MRFFRSRFVMFRLPCPATFICELAARQARLHARDLSRRIEMNMSGRRPEPGGSFSIQPGAGHTRYSPRAALARPGFSPLSRGLECGATEFPSREDDVSVNITSRTDFAVTAVDTSRESRSRQSPHISRRATFLSWVQLEIRVWPCSCTPLVIEAAGPERLPGTEAEHAGTNRSIRRKNL